MSNSCLSSIGKKLIMSISGLFLVLFLLFHMSMNLVAVFSGEAYNAVCEFLGANWYALVGTMVLALGFIVHIVFAFILSLQNRKARGAERYAYGVADGAAWMQYYFSQLPVVICYLVWFVAIWFHLSHDFWSALQTIGWNNKVWMDRWKCISNIFAIVVMLGFAAVVIAAYIKSLC